MLFDGDTTLGGYKNLFKSTSFVIKFSVSKCFNEKKIGIIEIACDLFCSFYL